jgi:hypothetical protein
MQLIECLERVWKKGKVNVKVNYTSRRIFKNSCFLFPFLTPEVNRTPTISCLAREVRNKVGPEALKHKARTTK